MAKETNQQKGFGLREAGLGLTAVGTVFDIVGINQNLKNSFRELDKQKDDIRFGYEQSKLEVEKSLANTWAGAVQAIGLVGATQSMDQISSNSTQQLYTIGGVLAEQEKRAEISITNAEINMNMELATVEMQKYYMTETANAGKTGAMFSGMTQGMMLYL